VYDPTAIVQTGPGLPRWSWTTLALTWSGPVTATQRLHLYLLSPAVNLVLAFLRAALLLVVIARMFPSAGRYFPRGWGPGASMGAAIAILGIVLAPGVARADVPSKEMLDDLASRLTRAPECLPSCATSGRMFLEARGDVLRARVE